MKYVAFFLNVLVGGTFLLSAYFKLLPIDFFEAKISLFGIEGVLGAILARLIIGVELIIGLFLIAQITFDKRLQKIILAVLSGFILINFIDYLRYGNDTNCGCMGTVVSMSPLVSVLKNVILILCTAISGKFSQAEWRLPRLTALLFAIIPLGGVFIYSPVYIAADSTMPKKGSRPDFSIMNGHPGFKGKTYNEDLSKGKKIVAFLSLTCPHCKLAAFKLNNYKKSDPSLPIYFILNGDSTDFSSFNEIMGKPDVAMAHFNGSADYGEMSGYDLPAIFLMNNGVVEVQLNNGSLSRSAINKWYSKK